MPELPEAARELLKSNQAYAHVVTMNRDGSPQVTLVWVDEQDGRLTFNTRRTRMKARNLERAPRVVVSVQDPSNLGQCLLVRGRATVTDEGAVEHIHRLSQKYAGRDYNLQPDEERVTVIVDADRIGGAGPWATAS